MEKNKPVVWTEIALQEYEESIDWLLGYWRPEIALRFSELIEKKINLIQKNPLVGSQSQYLPDCRKVWIPPYHLLIYKITPNSIDIIRLFDGRQNPDKLIEE